MISTRNIPESVANDQWLVDYEEGHVLGCYGFPMDWFPDPRIHLWYDSLLRWSGRY